MGPALFGRWERPVGDGRWWIMVKMQFAAPSVPVPSCSEEISVLDNMDEKSLCDSRKYYRESNVLRAGARTNCTTVYCTVFTNSQWGTWISKLKCMTKRCSCVLMFSVRKRCGSPYWAFHSMLRAAHRLPHPALATTGMIPPPFPTLLSY